MKSADNYFDKHRGRLAAYGTLGGTALQTKSASQTAKPARAAIAEVSTLSGLAPLSAFGDTSALPTG